MERELRNNEMRWNATVLVLGVIAYVAIPWLLLSVEEPGLTTRRAYLYWPALVAAAAYTLMRGSAQVRRKWLVALPSIPTVVFLIGILIVSAISPAVTGAPMGFIVAMIGSVTWLLVYFAGIGLCIVLSKGIRKLRSRNLV